MNQNEFGVSVSFQGRQYLFPFGSQAYIFHTGTTLFPFGKGIPLCSYGIKAEENMTAKDFPLCMYKNVCRKEQAEKESAYDEPQ